MHLLSRSSFTTDRALTIVSSRGATRGVALAHGAAGRREHSRSSPPSRWVAPDSASRLNRAALGIGNVKLQCRMRPCPAVVIGILPKHMLEMPPTEDDHRIKAFAPELSDESLGEPVHLKTPIARSDPSQRTTLVRCHSRLGGTFASTPMHRRERRPNCRRSRNHALFPDSGARYRAVRLGWAVSSQHRR
jgi:hypothetical protein